MTISAPKPEARSHRGVVVGLPPFPVNACHAVIMGMHAYPHRDRSVWWLWVGIFALVALLIYVAMTAFSTSSGDPVARASQGIEADPGSLQDPTQPPDKARKKAAPEASPTITLQGFQTTLPRVTVTRNVASPVPVPGPTITVRPPAVPGPVVTKTINARPAPTVTVTKTVQGAAPDPEPRPTVTKTVTEEVTETVTAEPKKPRPTVTITIYIPKVIKKPHPSPSGGE